MNLILNSAEKWRTNWKYLTESDIMQAVMDGTLTPELQAESHPTLTGNRYSGYVAMRAVFLFEGEQVSPIEAPYHRIDFKKLTVKKITELVMEEEPEVLAYATALNGGVRPTVHDPEPDPVPVPVVEETPTPAEGEGETPPPVEEPTDGPG